MHPTNALSGEAAATVTDRPHPTHPTVTVIRMKARLLRNGFRDPGLRRNTAIAFGVTVLSSGLGAFAVLQGAHAGLKGRENSLVSTFTLIFAAWIFAPLAFGGLDDTVDPTRLELLPLSGRERRLGILGASMLGFLPAFTVVVLGSVAVGYLGARSAPIVVLSALGHFAVCVLSGRWIAAALAVASKSRRGRDLALVVASVASVALWSATQSLAFVSEHTFSRVLRVLQVLPSGLNAQAIVEAKKGNLSGGLARVLLSGLVVFGLYVSWARLLDGPLGNPTLGRSATRPRQARSRTRRGTLSTTAVPQWQVLVLKELRYLRRSPQRRAALTIAMVLGGPILLVQFLANASRPEGVYFAPFALIFSMGSVNNLLGVDAPSLWLEVTSGARLRTIVLSRSIAAAPFVVLPVFTAATVVATVVGFGRHYVVVVLLAFLGAGIPLGVGCVASVLIPFPQHDVDDPFSNRRTASGEGCLVGLVAGFTMAVTSLLAIPLVVLRVSAGDSAGSVAVLCGLTTLYAGGLWAGCVSFAGRRAERRTSDLLAVLTDRGSHA